MTEGGIVSLAIDVRDAEVCVTIETRGLERDNFTLAFSRPRQLELRALGWCVPVPLPVDVEEERAIATLRNGILDVRCPMKVMSAEVGAPG